MQTTTKWIVGIAAAALIVLTIGSCSRMQQQVAYVQPQAQVIEQGQPVQAQPPVIVQQPQVIQQGSNDGFLTGMLMGHMMGGYGGYGNTTIIHQPTTIVHAAPAPVYRAAPISRPSYSTNSRGITTSRSGGSIRVGRR